MIESKEEGVKKLGDALDEYQRVANCTIGMCLVEHDFISATTAINEHVTYLYERLTKHASWQWDRGMNVFDSYIHEIRAGAADAAEAMPGLKALIDHPDTLTNIAGGAIGLVQLAAGVSIFSASGPLMFLGGAGVAPLAVGGLTIAHGVNNVQESVMSLYAVFVQDATINTNGLVRNGYMTLAESFGREPVEGSMFYSFADVTLSAASIGGRLHLKKTLADGSRNLILFRVSRFDFERGYNLMKARNMAIEAGGFALNANRYYQDRKSLSEKKGG